MTKQTARRHLFPNSVVSREASRPGQCMGYPRREVNVCRLKHRMFGSDWLAVNGDLGHPNFALRGGTRSFGLFGCLPGPLRPPNLQFGWLDLHVFHYLWKTNLLGHRRRRRFFGPNRLLGRGDLKDGLLRPSSLNPLFGFTLAFALRARGHLGILP